ncbi:MAG: prenyltransferase [Acidobacteriota bacterium]|nr:prenyltransferase [Acidobacteriota bacterium]
MSELTFLLKISRPRFWIYIIGPYLIGIAAAAQNSSQFTDFEVLIFGAFFLFPANLLIYGINDIFDYETDKLNPKKRDYELVVVPERRRNLVIAIMAANLPFLAIALLGYPRTFPALAGFLFFSIGYSAPPVRAKTKPFLDSVFNVLYIFPALFAYMLVSGNSPSLLATAGAGSWTMAMHAYSAIPDIKSDREARIRTIATELGSAGTLSFCLVCYVVSAAIAYRYIGFFAVGFAAAYLIMLAFSFRFRNSDRLFEVYKLFPILNTVIGFLLFWVIAYPKLV